MKMRLALLSLVLSSILLSCGSSMDAATYNNELMAVINNNEKQINDMNSAMNAKDYAKAEQVRGNWESALAGQIEQVKKIGSYKGDDVLQAGVLKGLSAYQKIVTADYKELIAIRKSGAKDASDASKEENALNNINTAFETASNEVNKAASTFEEKYAK